MFSINMVLRQLSYKLDHKLEDLKARFCEDRRTVNTGDNLWNPTTGGLDSLHLRKFGRLLCKLGTHGALARYSRPAY